MRKEQARVSRSVWLAAQAAALFFAWEVTQLSWVMNPSS